MATVCATATMITLYFVLIYLGNSVLKIGIADASAIFLSVMPFVMYLILSGKIQEFRGGGIEVKFKEAFEQAVRFKPETATYTDYRVIKKGDREALLEAVRKMADSPFAALSLKIGERYDQALLKDYVEELTDFESFKYVVFIDDSGKFEGFMGSRVLLSHLKPRHLGPEVIDLIQSGRIKETPGFRIDTVRNSSSSKQVLDKLETEKIEDVAVLDEHEHLLGFTDREEIVAGVVNVFLASA